MFGKSKSLFINISNHPTCNWDAKQLEGAYSLFKDGSEKTVELIDLPFPNVSPKANEEDVIALANSLVESVIHQQDLRKLDNTSSIVHIMGELGVVHTTVNFLYRLNHYTCYYSATERYTTNRGKDKVSKFAFVRFRMY